jgi:hypothetical protein
VCVYKDSTKSQAQKKHTLTCLPTYIKTCVKYQVLTAVTMDKIVVWYVTPCSQKKNAQTTPDLEMEAVKFSSLKPLSYSSSQLYLTHISDKTNLLGDRFY